ncbi:HTH domain-containing protein [Halorientalis pallida]|uniref:HTH domain-containing protein n=1 Tax=Halorientalis pallida TaxID=2479928 RepID=UPI003C6F26D3
MTARKSEVASQIPDGPMTVTLRRRSDPSSVARRRQQRLTERLETVAEGANGDDLAELRTGHWSDRVRVPAAEGSAAVEAVTLYEELRAAVDEAGGRLHPFFQEHETLDSVEAADLTDGSRDGGERDIVFPVVCLTIRRRGRLTGVYPCWLDGDHHSVEDGLARLEAATDGVRRRTPAVSGDAENLW